MPGAGIGPKQCPRKFAAEKGTCRTQHNRRAGRNECEESKAFQQATDPAPDAEKRYLQRERATALRNAINELHPSLRVAVELRHFAERSIHETAETLAVSIGATKSRLFHARAALRNSAPQISQQRPENQLELSNDLKMEAIVQ